jgi:hypothetical protein
MIIARLRNIIMPMVPLKTPPPDPKNYHTACLPQKSWRTRTIALEIVALPVNGSGNSRQARQQMQH